MDRHNLETHTKGPSNFQFTSTAYHDWSKSIPLKLILDFDYAKISWIFSDRSRYVQLESDTRRLQVPLSNLNLDLVVVQQDVTMTDVAEGTFGLTVKGFPTTMG